MRFADYIAIIAAIVTTFFLGRMTVPDRHTGTVETVITDTVTLTKDSIVLDTVYLTRTETRTLPVVITDTFNVTDTVYEQVLVPYSTYIAEKEGLYHIEATGYDVTFDRIDCYPKTIIKTGNTVKKTHWGLGLQAGYGISSGGLSPYIGIGISYNFISWNWK